MRPTWDEYFLDIAEAVSKRASCSRAQHGAVIVTADQQILATGYNCAPAGLRHCDHDLRLTAVWTVNLTETLWLQGDLVNGHCSRAQHAERNAIAFAAKHGVAVNG